MFDAMKAMGALAGLMKNKDAIKAAGERIKTRLGEIRAAGGSGGGAVRATVSGDMKVVSITLEPAVVAGLGGRDDKTRDEVLRLIGEAINNAQDIAREMARREISKEAEALGLGGIPGMENLLGG